MIDLKPTLLIADDTVENIDILYNLLKDEYQIIVAKDGKETLKIIAEKHLPDLVLLDIIMPDMDGFDTIIELKKNPLTKNIPVIFLTSLTDVEDLVKGFSLGAVDYVGKPFNAPELLSRVKTQITIKKHEDLIKQRSNELKELLQIMCHDLASHFSVIKSSVWLSENKEEVTLDSYKDRIKMATYNGIDIINLVREMRTVEDKQIPLEKVNLLEIVSESLRLHNDNLEAKNIKVNIAIPDNLHVLVEPRSFINSVINNILSNAIKFSYENSFIKISGLKNKDGINLSFKDSGIGIPVNLLNELFELSKKTNRPGTKGEKGTGFGMPLIKKFVELYGGKIIIKSSVKHNQGTEVILLLNEE
jgi:two-component system, sensor histidine kinase and response regulator